MIAMRNKLKGLLTPRELDMFDDSLARCLADPDFLKRFYDIFIGSSEEVREKFRDTNLHRQTKMVKASLYLLLLATQGMPEGEMHLDRIAALHGKDQLAIGPKLYELWLNSLLQAVREHDGQCRSEVEQVWRTLMGAGIEIMIEKGGVS